MIDQVIEDSKSAVVFTTERVVCSLADLLRSFDHIAGGAAAHFDFFNSGAVLSNANMHIYTYIH